MKLLRDTWLIFQRNLVAILRNPVWVIIGLIQPILYLGLFAPLLDGIAKSPGFPPGGALTVFLPGLLIQLALFGAAFVEHYAATRDWEEREYRRAITDWQMQRYFEII